MRRLLRVLMLLPLAVLMGGCMRAVEIRFVDASSGEPLADLPMTKARVTTALFMRAVAAEGLQADEEGVVLLEDFGDQDELIVEHGGRLALIRRAGQELLVSQELEKAGGNAVGGTRIGPDEGGGSATPRYTVPLRNPAAPRVNPHRGQVVRAW